jgi:enterochelin esterase-like enzyme
MKLSRRTLRSAALDDDLHYHAAIPAGVGPFPVVYLLHGRGDTADSWEPVLDDLDALPPFIAVLPDAPWSDRASYYVDSANPGGRPVETALVRDLVPHVDATYPTIAERGARTVAGYSMGGAGAVRLGLAYPELFSSVIALSPAVYLPEPPLGSSAREWGAFGVPGSLFDGARYRELAYPTLLERFPDGLPLRLFVAVGDDETPHPGAPESLSMTSQAAELVARAGRVPEIQASYSEYPGGHDFKVWGPSLRDGLRTLHH